VGKETDIAQCAFKCCNVTIVDVSRLRVKSSPANADYINSPCALHNFIRQRNYKSARQTNSYR
jgi:hypothetical protein